jgi:hypothetical protein
MFHIAPLPPIYSRDEYKHLNDLIAVPKLTEELPIFMERAQDMPDSMISTDTCDDSSSCQPLLAISELLKVFDNPEAEFAKGMLV